MTSQPVTPAFIATVLTLGTGRQQFNVLHVDDE